jgi:hypothetical protein
MRFIGSMLFNPALLDFLVILAVLNLGANLLHWFGLVDLDLAHASRATATGFVISVIYTGARERPTTRT